ncbi:hypothetical protein BX600DRAFT_510552 [Xylariales sp. PMI_506]|nr:hypothetical protein BX600DRAFT_510552 [Xylariales sp. PMI_506]
MCKILVPEYGCSCTFIVYPYHAEWCLFGEHCSNLGHIRQARGLRDLCKPCEVSKKKVKFNNSGEAQGLPPTPPPELSPNLLEITEPAESTAHLEDYNNTAAENLEQILKGGPSWWSLLDLFAYICGLPAYLDRERLVDIWVRERVADDETFDQVWLLAEEDAKSAGIGELFIKKRELYCDKLFDEWAGYGWRKDDFSSGEEDCCNSDEDFSSSGNSCTSYYYYSSDGLSSCEEYTPNRNTANNNPVTVENQPVIEAEEKAIQPSLETKANVE